MWKTPASPCQHRDIMAQISCDTFHCKGVTACRLRSGQSSPQFPGCRSTEHGSSYESCAVVDIIPPYRSRFRYRRHIARSWRPLPPLRRLASAPRQPRNPEKYLTQPKVPEMPAVPQNSPWRAEEIQKCGGNAAKIMDKYSCIGPHTSSGIRRKVRMKSSPANSNPSSKNVVTAISTKDAHMLSHRPSSSR